jgi:hypothetical protein
LAVRLSNCSARCCPREIDRESGDNFVRLVYLLGPIGEISLRILLLGFLLIVEFGLFNGFFRALLTKTDSTHEIAVAYDNWQAHPTPENYAALRRTIQDDRETPGWEQKSSQRVALIILCFVVLNGLLIRRVYQNTFLHFDSPADDALAETPTGV